jgi:hypothetical protein
VPAQVTATGIRDGDPAVLSALVERRGSAVLAYCERACPRSVALDAAADAFVRFREAVRSAERPAALDPEAALLSATRHAAAAHVPRPPADVARSVDRVAVMLAGAADGDLAPDDAELLAGLLTRSPVARTIADRFRAAEEAYKTAPRRSLPSPLASRLIGPMAAVEADRAERFTSHVAETSGAVDVGPEPRAAASPAGGRDAPEGETGSHDTGAEEPRRESHAAAADGEPADDELGAEWPGGTVDAGPDVEDESHLAAASGAAEVEPAPTEEWAPPPEAGDEGLEAEVAAAQASEEQDEPAHLQSASGAVDDASTDAAASTDGAPAKPTDDAVSDDDAAAEPGQAAAPSVPAAALLGAAPAAAGAVPSARRDRSSLSARAALIPAGAVVAIAAVGALAASGVLGGNDPSPPLDTRIVPQRPLQAVPEGEAAAVVDDLRSAAADARRKRLAERREALAAARAEALAAAQARAAAQAEAERQAAERSQTTGRGGATSTTPLSPTPPAPQTTPSAPQGSAGVSTTP